MLCVELGRIATGSPQPPPGGGLLLTVAGPSARLRDCLFAMLSLFDCGLFARNRSVRTERAAASPREGPLLAYRSFACASQAAARGRRLKRDSRISALKRPCGPQPPGGGGPQLASRRLRPENIGRKAPTGRAGTGLGPSWDGYKKRTENYIDNPCLRFWRNGFWPKTSIR